MVEERALKAINRALARNDITIDNTFAELGVDSLDAMELLFEVEEEFDITIPNEAAQSIVSIREVVEGVKKMLEGRAVEMPNADTAEAG